MVKVINRLLSIHHFGFKVKYLNKRWMDRHETLWRHSSFPVDGSLRRWLTFHLAPPVGKSISTSTKWIDIYFGTDIHVSKMIFGFGEPLKIFLWPPAGGHFWAFQPAWNVSTNIVDGLPWNLVATRGTMLNCCICAAFLSKVRYNLPLIDTHTNL